jgi:hypothetical protein
MVCGISGKAVDEFRTQPDDTLLPEVLSSKLQVYIRAAWGKPERPTPWFAYQAGVMLDMLK